MYLQEQMLLIYKQIHEFDSGENSSYGENVRTRKFQPLCS